jgi:hypothetical protein
VPMNEEKVAGEGDVGDDAFTDLRDRPDEPAGGLVGLMPDLHTGADGDLATDLGPPPAIEPLVGEHPPGQSVRLGPPLGIHRRLHLQRAQNFRELLRQQVPEFLPRRRRAQFPPNGGEVVLQGLVDLVPELLVGHFQHPHHRLVVKIHNQVADKDDVVADFGHAVARNLAAVGDDVVDRLVLGGDAQRPVSGNGGLEKLPVERRLVLRDQRVVLVDDQLVEELLTVQIDGASADLPPEDRDAVLTAVLQVHLLLHILEIADTDVGRGGGEEIQPLPPDAGKGVVEELRIGPGDSAETVEFHGHLRRNPGVRSAISDQRSIICDMRYAICDTRSTLTAPSAPAAGAGRGPVR